MEPQFSERLGQKVWLIPQVLKVSYFIKKRGWHENQSDGTRHKQKESTDGI